MMPCFDCVLTWQFLCKESLLTKTLMSVKYIPATFLECQLSQLHFAIIRNYFVDFFMFSPIKFFFAHTVPSSILQ